MTSAEALNTSIQELYAAFADVPKPLKIEGCICCIEGKNVDVLLSTPLREIDSPDLIKYASSAFLTIGDEADYLYLLPRILEITATDNGWWPTPEVTGLAMANTAPRKWPKQRRDALMNFLMAALQHYMEQEDSGKLVDSWLCLIGNAGLDVKPFLTHLEDSPAQVISFYEVNAKKLHRMELGNGFWEKRTGAYEDILTWFGSDVVSDILFKTYGIMHYSQQVQLPNET